jgi:OOP family OmpA-OmpF porin
MKTRVLTGALILALAGSMSASWGAASLETKNCGPKTATFMVDYSGSMMESYNKDEKAKKEREEKAEALKYEGKKAPEWSDEDKAYNRLQRMTYAKEILKKIAETYPVDGAKTGLYSLAPYTAIIPVDKITPEDYAKGVDRLKTNMEVVGRRTPAGIAFADHSATLQEAKIAAPAIVIFTNGEINRGRNAVEALKKFYAENPKSCVSFVSFADTDEGRRQIAELAAVKPCSKVVEARDIYKDEKKLVKFVNEVLMNECEKILSVTGINFAFDKYNIDAKSERILNEALNFIKQQDPDEKIEINGWTDWCGSDAYNAVLSLNRAKAVRGWLINHGIDANRLTVKGNGKSFKFDNKTREGRYRNRRMDFRFFKSGVTTDERLANESEK